MKTKLRSTDDVMREIENIYDSVVIGQSPIDVADIRVRCCKHAIQIIALTYAFNRERGLSSKKMEHLEVK